MVRFTAYNSDTGSSASENEDENTSNRELRRTAEPGPDPESDADNGSSSSSSSPSEMQEEELRSSPPARRKTSRKQDRNALVEDENGEICFAHQVHVHVPSSSSSNSSPPAKSRLNNPRDDPSVIPWAKHVGVDAQTMHVMQTSLFRMPEEAAALKALQQAPKPAPAIRLDVSMRNQTVNRKHSRDSDGDGLRIDSREVGLFRYTRAVYWNTFLKSAPHLRTTWIHPCFVLLANMPASRLNHRLLMVMRGYTSMQACPWAARSESAGDLEGSWCIWVVYVARLPRRKSSTLSTVRWMTIFFSLEKQPSILQ